MNPGLELGAALGAELGPCPNHAFHAQISAMNPQSLTFASVPGDTQVPDLATLRTAALAHATNKRVKGPTWWSVHIEAAEVWVDQPVGAPPTRVPSVDLTNDTPRCSLYAVITAVGSPGTGDCRSSGVSYVTDCPGRWAVYASSIEIQVAGPNVQQVTVGEISPLTGVVAYSQVSALCYPAPYAGSSHRARVSARIRVPAGAANTEVDVPNWATAVSISEDPSAGGSTWEMVDRLRTATDVFGSIVVGGIPTAVPLPSFVSALRLAAPKGTDRSYSFTFLQEWW